MRWAASHCRSGRAIGSRPSSIDSTLVPVRGSPTMIHGLSMRSSSTPGCSSDQRCRSIRLARAAASILVIRMRPKVVRSASRSHDDRKTSRGSRKESEPRSSEPASLTAAATTDAGVSDGSSRPMRAMRRPTRLRTLRGGLLSSESRQV